ncbi:cysteinyl leukotriene receptor 2-like [Engraulis encrasicolus]|uniref:cysteinyl leukotriene receptor 2-like n=1 Tax=Engraulis encrasicolus TaxID=184585 RepID=UPI002FD35D2F
MTSSTQVAQPQMEQAGMDNGTSEGDNLVSDTEVLPWLYLFLALLGFLTNGLVLYQLWRTQRKPTTIFTLNMAASDITLCISFFFRIAYYKNSTKWSADAAPCMLTLSICMSVFYVNIYCNMCFLLWTSINRYVTVVQPRQAVLQAFRNPQKCLCLCAATWVMFLVGVSTRVAVNEVRLANSTETCEDLMEHLKKEQMMSLALGVLLFFSILGAMLVSYSLLMYHLQKIHRSSLVSAWFGPGGGLKVKRKVMASVLVFLACFLPHHIQRSIMLLSGSETDSQTEERHSKVMRATILIAALNCCLNPILHLVLRLPCCRVKRPTSSNVPVAADSSRNQVPQIYITEASG